MVLGGEETVLTLKRLLSMRRDSIACGSGGQGWERKYPSASIGGGGGVGGMIPRKNYCYSV